MAFHLIDHSMRDLNMKLKPKQSAKIANTPQKTAEAADLVYVHEDQFSIIRKRHGRGFTYFKNDQKITNKKELDRFKSLVIPPSWAEVRICSLKNGHLQALGKDEKGRTQYRYHPLWNQIRSSTKFFRMSAFGKALPTIRKQVEKDLKNKVMHKEKCIALVIRLMEETHIRIGNAYYAKKNRSYGLSTLRRKHVKYKDSALIFNFTGKKGVKQSVTLEDEKLQKLVIQCEEIPGWELFQYYDEEGEHHSIDSGMVNSYIQRVSGESFTAKDFRTWSASKIFLETLLSFDKTEIQKEKEKNITEACRISAQELGNTQSVCKNYYIHPALISKYIKGEIAEESSRRKKIHKIKGLDDSENYLMDLISNYAFDIVEE